MGQQFGRLATGVISTFEIYFIVLVTTKMPYYKIREDLVLAL